MSAPLLTTKFQIPQVRSGLVSRPRLTERLTAGSGGKLTLITAPAGFGKTTLLAEWIAGHNQPFAWLSLDKGDNDPAHFWSYFVLAVQVLAPHAGSAILKNIHSPHLPDLENPFIDFLNELTQLEYQVILVLDDYHLIKNRQIHEAIVYLIDHLPTQIHLVIASRAAPPWPLARWRVLAELNELHSADLRFSYAETVQFLHQILQLKLSTQDIDILQERTEGWIAGLKLAAVSIQGRMKAQGSQSVSRFIESFSGSNRFILDYLMEEVISQQPDEVKNFLQETAILEQMTAPLCNALLGRQDSQEILVQMEQANLFLVPLDDERKWYRYHLLFAELLRKRLKQIQPDQVIELHRRASRWYAEHNLLSEAILHAVEAGDYQRVNEIVSVNAYAVVEHADLTSVLRHFEELPNQLFTSQPWLCVAYAWVKVFVDPSGGVDQILHQVRQCLAGMEDVIERQRLVSHLDSLQAYMAWLKGEADLALEFFLRALQNLPENDWLMRAQMLNSVGLAQQYRGDMPASIEAFRAAINVGRNASRSFHIIVQSNLAWSYLMQGRLRQVISLCQQLISQGDKPEHDGQFSRFLAIAYGSLSLVQLEWNQIEAALSNARQCVALSEQWKQADTLVSTLLILTKVLYTAGELQEACEINQRAMQVGEKVSPMYFQAAANDEVWINLVKDDIPAAARRFAEIEPGAAEKDKKGRLLVTKAYLFNAQGRYEETLLALKGPVKELEQQGNYWYLLKLLPLQALALNALGRVEEALAVIGHCLALAAPEGFVRIFVEHGAPMARLLQVAWSRGIETEYIHRLLPAFNLPEAGWKSDAVHIPGARSKSRGIAMIEPLSDREIQVLRLLDSRLTNEEIGRELYVSVNTIRTHIRNIYSKLGVNRRGEAIDKAKELKLI